MNTLEQFAIASFLVQIFHSVEELSTGFHKKWYLFRMPFWAFFAFEACFAIFWATVIFTPAFPNKSSFLLFFIALMLANGVQHIVWWGFVRRYVPGLITAPLHIIVALLFYVEMMI